MQDCIVQFRRFSGQESDQAFGEMITDLRTNISTPPHCNVPHRGKKSCGPA